MPRRPRFCPAGMPIHVVQRGNNRHLLLTPKDVIGVSKLMQTLGRLYVRYFNYGYQRTGTLFEGRYKSSVVQQEEYFLNCPRYIELNPVRAGVVNDPGDYKWSSYRAHAFGVKVKMWTPHVLYSELAVSEIERQSHYRKWMSEAMATEVLGKIRACLEKGLVLGTDRFREQVGSLKR